MTNFLVQFPTPLIPIEELRYQLFDPKGERVKKLARLMTDHQMLDPIKVDPRGGDGKHAVIDGAHRVAASKAMGYSHAPAIVLSIR